MAAFDTTRPHFSSTASAGHIGSIFVSAFSALSAWNDTRLTRKSLGKLTDRELDDIGLSRAEIDLVAGRR